jgi:hypothetical protein
MYYLARIDRAMPAPRDTWMQASAPKENLACNADSEECARYQPARHP